MTEKEPPLLSMLEEIATFSYSYSYSISFYNLSLALPCLAQRNINININIVDNFFDTVLWFMDCGLIVV